MTEEQDDGWLCTQLVLCGRPLSTWHGGWCYVITNDVLEDDPRGMGGPREDED